MDLFSSSNPFKRKREPSPPPVAAAAAKLESESDDDDVGEVEQAPAKKARFDSEEKLRRTIFVGNLPMQTKKKALIKEFGGYGAVESARLRSIPVGTIDLPRKAALSTGQTNESRSSVNAFVVFKDEEAAAAALGHNMKLVGEKHIRVDRALAPRTTGESSSRSRSAPATYDSDRTIFLGNVPFDVEEEELHALFAEGVVEAVRVVRDPRTNIGKGFAFLLFRSQDSVKQALSKKAGLELRGRSLRVQRVSKMQQHVRRPASKQNKNRALSYEGARATTKQRKYNKPAAQVAAPNKQRGPVKKRPSVAARKEAQKRAKQQH